MTPVKKGGRESAEHTPAKNGIPVTRGGEFEDAEDLALLLKDWEETPTRARVEDITLIEDQLLSTEALRQQMVKVLYISRIRRNLFIHIARIPIGDSPRVHPNILKCSLHLPVARVIRLVVFAIRAMVCDTHTHCLILNSLASARGRVILRSHFLILLLLIILISLYSHLFLTYTVILLLCDRCVRIFQQCSVDADR